MWPRIPGKAEPLSAEAYLALDLGAESGRAVLGRFDGQKLQVNDIHRFLNVPVRLQTGLYWNILQLFQEVRAGIRAAQQQERIVSVGVDTWGVDFGLLDAHDVLLGNPVHYRDARTEGMQEKAFERVPREQIFEQTGIQFLPINTLFQLFSLAQRDDAALKSAATFLTVPDLLNFWLTGVKVCEFTNATTTQCFNPRSNNWALDVLSKLDIPTQMFPEVVPAGCRLGGLLEDASVSVLASASHDTASAVLGTPLRGLDSAYISSGTWSLVGVEVSAPVINADTLALNFTNEGGVGNTFRLLRNVIGLWLVQGIRRACVAPSDYAALTQLATNAPPLQAVIDPDAPVFLRAENMVAAIRTYCLNTGQVAPHDVGALVRTALESLALRYRWVIECLERLTSRSLHTIHIVGGGANNALLCQMTADATGRVVLAGPTEATALGNLAMQAMASGSVASVAEARQLIADSFPPRAYVPDRSGDDWDAAYERFTTLVGGTSISRS